MSSMILPSSSERRTLLTLGDRVLPSLVRRGVKERPSDVRDSLRTRRRVGDGVKGLCAGDVMDDVRDEGRSSDDMMRWAAAAILGWTGFLIFRFFSDAVFEGDDGRSGDLGAKAASRVSFKLSTP